ncbi:hypothetical protein BU24DRAFT_492906 [Aaosphaeria arxii CBS 175.79]|uniref:NACHT domain-containing protein n=1 Tax=Aaosphaeria arxii CBS 175.79 TaxID=1450172 RepID=A0A6A5XMP2_9PLEO|nr:uncharacterized protein BU24DRAFT_492906 [Aaosphaeria arxii CBS 175.79]KAF2014213.1 hypothetical protein BU24DRAFT_492906 [Aaosphaeria arxii CBS 175.79]
MGADGPQSEATDLGALWTKAILDYKNKTGTDLTHMKAMSMSQVQQNAEGSMQKFKSFRHGGGKMDKVRTAFGNHLDAMQKCMAGIEAVGAAAGAFPPAMPVGLIFMAAGRLLAAFAGVKADYDKVEQFFAVSNRFFDRLSLIENKGAGHGPMMRAIVRVFSAQLSICGTVEAKIKESASRLKQFFNNLWNMEDPELAGQYGSMQNAIEELDQTVGYASYAAIKDTQDVTEEMSSSIDEIDANIKKFRDQLGQDVQKLYESSLDIKAEISVLRTDQRAGFSFVTEQNSTYHAETIKLLKSIQSTQLEKSRPVGQGSKAKQQKGSGKGDAGDKKNKALKGIKNFFDGKSEVFPEWRDAHKENAAQNREMKESCIAKTGDWLLETEEFQSWSDGKNPFLWLHGSEGIGKSFLVQAALQKLSAREDATVAYFYFKEDFAYLQSVQNAFASVAMQIAEQDAKYAESVAAKLKDADSSPDTPTWKRFFLQPFPSSSSNTEQLFIIFDGLDEAPEQQRQALLEFVDNLKEEASRVHVMVTSQPTSLNNVEELNPLTLEVTKELMTQDIRYLVRDRLKSLARLRKFSLPTKKYIRKRVVAQADGMLYVEHMLRRLSYIGREGAVRKDLENMPENLHALYKLMLDECRRYRTPEQYEALKKLFAWLAFSKRSLSLAEASELVKLTIKDKDDDFDVEAETIGRSARLLELSGPRTAEDETKDETKDDDNDDEGEDQITEIDDKERSITFQERSLRQYFKALSVEENHGEELRTPASAAHLTILTMCIDVLMDSAKLGVTAPDDSILEIRGYALKFWHEHFNEIDLESASGEDLARVLATLKKVLTNENNIANLFQRTIYAATAYPERSEEGTRPWYDRVQPWAAKAVTNSPPELDPEVKSWAADIAGDSGELLLPLAQGHLNDWIVQNEAFFLGEAYLFAQETLKLCNRFTPAEDDPKAEIFSILNAFGEREENFQTLRAIGFQLDNASTTLEDERKLEVQQEAIDYLNKSIETTGDDFFEKSATYMLLILCYARKLDWQKAIDSTENSLLYFKKAHEGATPEKLKVLEGFVYEWWFYTEKAGYLDKAGSKDEALEMYNEARRLVSSTKEEILDGWYLDEITRILDESVDPDGQRLMKVLKEWTEKERNAWVTYCINLNLGIDVLGRMYRAAKLTGEMDLVIEWLVTIEKTIPPKSFLAFKFKLTLAEVHSKVLKDDEKAKEALHAALEMHPKVDGSDEDAVTFFISSARMDLAALIWNQFRASSDPERKEALLGEIKSLPGMRTEDELRESHIGMLVANMLRIMGPAREYHRQMQLIFKTCIDGLEDDVSYNDSDSLRLLAKVLSSLDGLEHDARITISSQFSIMDRNIHDNESSNAGSENGDGSNAGDDAEGAPDVDAVNEEPSPEANPDGGEAKAGNGEGQTSADMKPEEKSVEEPPKQERHDTPLDGSESPQVNGSTDNKEATSENVDESKADSTDVDNKDGDKPAEGEANGTDAEADKSDEEGDEEKEDEDEDDQDIGEYYVGCDGGCGTSISRYTESFYLCLVCPNVDLCEDCHTKRQAWNRGESEPSWQSFCGDHHHYIKTPMKNWRGIKDGVIRIGEEETTVKEWIKGLKEERWPAAWNNYWTRQSGLKDIDDGE